MIYDISGIGRRIRELRKEKWKLYKEYKENKDTNNKRYEKYCYCETLETFAEKLDVDRRTIGKWEKGESLPSLDKLALICELLDCQMDYFLGADELPYIDSIAKASHFTGINPEIIDRAITNDKYLDCLNFFMLPEIFAELYEDITLSGWKNFFVEKELSNIKSPLIDRIEKIFENFYSLTPYSEMSIEKYKDYLINKLDKNELDFYSTEDKPSIISIRKSLQILTYKDFERTIQKGNEYDCFIDFIANLTYDPLIRRKYIELEKQKIAKRFIELVTRYLKDIEV